MKFRHIKEYYRSHSIGPILCQIDKHYGLGRIEEILSGRWINPFATLWLNFRCFPAGQAWKLPVWVFGCPKFTNLSGTMKIARGHVKSGMIRFNAGRIGAPERIAGDTELYLCGDILFHGSCTICSASKISVMTDARLSFGNKTIICEQVNVGCFGSITLEDEVRITHRSQIFDSNYHYIADLGTGLIPDYISSVRIGRGCWICNSSSIGPGTVLPPFTIVGSHSIVGRDYSSIIPENSLIGGAPAKLLRSGIRRVNNLEIIAAAQEYYRDHSGAPYPIPADVTADDISAYEGYKD